MMTLLHGSTMTVEISEKIPAVIKLCAVTHMAAFFYNPCRCSQLQPRPYKLIYNGICRNKAHTQFSICFFAFRGVLLEPTEINLIIIVYRYMNSLSLCFSHYSINNVLITYIANFYVGNIVITFNVPENGIQGRTPLWVSRKSTQKTFQISVM